MIQLELVSDTMDFRCVKFDGQKYAQVFSNTGYFSHTYPMEYKNKKGDALRLFCQEFGVPVHLTLYGSNEHSTKGTTFIKQFLTHNIDYHISKADLHNQNSVDGVIR